MREIKFRVRNLEENKFEDLSDVIINFDGAGYEIYKYDGSVLYSYELNQYTGLKDKNGKEIYEGDILKIYSPVSSKEPIIGQVYYINGMFKVKDKGYYLIDGGGISLCSFLFTKVIGNIYEDKQ